MDIMFYDAVRMIFLILISKILKIYLQLYTYEKELLKSS